MKKLFLLLSLLVFCFSAFAQTTLGGKITDIDTGEELIGANVTVSQKRIFITGTSTDFDGNYKLSLEPGIYDVKVTYVGFPPNKLSEVIVREGQNNSLNIQLGGGIEIDYIVHMHYPIPLICKDETSSGRTIDQETIQTNSSKNINTISGNTPGVTLSW